MKNLYVMQTNDETKQYILNINELNKRFHDELNDEFDCNEIDFENDEHVEMIINDECVGFYEMTKYVDDIELIKRAYELNNDIDVNDCDNCDFEYEFEICVNRRSQTIECDARFFNCISNIKNNIEIEMCDDVNFEIKYEIDDVNFKMIVSNVHEL